MSLLINNYVAETWLINIGLLHRNSQKFFERYETVLTDVNLSPADIFSDPTEAAFCRCSIEQLFWKLA